MTKFIAQTQSLHWLQDNTGKWLWQFSPADQVRCLTGLTGIWHKAEAALDRGEIPDDERQSIEFMLCNDPHKLMKLIAGNWEEFSNEAQDLLKNYYGAERIYNQYLKDRTVNQTVNQSVNH